jgi:AcrR family transcriptional regulator
MAPNPPSRNRRPATDRKFSRIIAAAAKVFAKTGYEKASIRMVAARARVSLAGIYYHVQSKDELLFLIQLNAFDSILKRLRKKKSDAPSAEPDAMLRLLVDNHLDYFLNRLEELRVCSRELETLSGSFYRKIAEVRREYFKEALEIVKGIAGKSGNTVDPRTATLCLFGMLNWVYTWYEPAKDTPESLCEKLLALYLGGVRSEL